jgi:FMN-dependent NADH-azoreductase
MKKILHVSCSPRGQAAESYRLSQTIISFLLKKEPEAIVINRVIGNGAIAHVDEAYAISQASSADVSRDGSMAQSEELIRELEAAAFVVIGTPMHNLTVPSALKAWIDHVVRARRTFMITPAGKVGTLRDRPVFVAISSGGRFSGERAPARFSDPLSESHPRHHWAARSDLLFRSGNRRWSGCGGGNQDQDRSSTGRAFFFALRSTITGVLHRFRRSRGHANQRALRVRNSNSCHG